MTETTRDPTAARRSATVATVAFVAVVGACGFSPKGAPPAGGDVWYSTHRDGDTSYLPLGAVPYARVALAGFDAYVPETKAAPVVLFLPGALVVKERYQWVGESFASHGFATIVVQPPHGFARTSDTVGALAALAAQGRDPGSPLYGRLDLGRVILAGHSYGALIQALLLDPASCGPSSCDSGPNRPDGIRGLLLYGFDAVDPTDPSAAPPLAAGDVPWLILNGTQDGLATPAKSAATFARIQDRPALWIEVAGMNHFQLTDYVDPNADAGLRADLAPSIPSASARAIAAQYGLAFAARTFGDTSVPADLGAAQDARVTLDAKAPRLAQLPEAALPRILASAVGMPGLDGGSTNTDVVAAREFQGALYLLVRNDETGGALFRLGADGAIDAVSPPPGASAQLNASFGALEVFADRLWVGFSSGIQGLRRDSVGAELWTYDGANWQPIVSNQRAPERDPEVVVSSCKAAAGGTASLGLSSAALAPGAWQGAVLDDLDRPSDAPILLDVVDNTTSSLVVQDEAVAGHPTAPDCAALLSGARFRLRLGMLHNGFGQPWNKAITALAVFGGGLYVATGLNLAHGAELYATADAGASFMRAIPQSFFGQHPGGEPISSSITALHASTVEGATRLYVAATGTQNYGARLAALGLDGRPRFLIDGSVGGSNPLTQAGLGRSTPQFASLATFQGRLWLGSFDTRGLEIYSAARPSGPEADYRVEVGDGAPIPRGFGDPLQIVADLQLVRGQLWLGTTAYAANADALRDVSACGLRSADGVRWQPMTAHAFGLNAVALGHFVDFAGAIHAVSGRAALATRGGYGPLRLLRLRAEPQ